MWRILVEYAYSFLRLIFNNAQLRFNHCPLYSFITAQIGSVTSYFRPCLQLRTDGSFFLCQRIAVMVVK